MPRKARLFVPGATYHVYCRTARGERVFADRTEAEAFIETTRLVQDTDRFTVLAWCLMSNHYHLVVRTGTVPLWRTMARLQGRVARGFNRRHRYVGRLWQTRYKARVVDTEAYFVQVVAYVHLNPVVAGMVEDPAAFPWSGHAALIGQRPPLLVDPHQALRGFGTTLGKARQHYLATVRAVAQAHWLTSGLTDLPWWSDASDADTIADIHAHPQAVRHDGNHEPAELPDIPLRWLVRRYCHETTTAFEQLAGSGRVADVIESRIELTALAVLRFDHSVAAVATLLNKNPGTVSRWLGIGRHRCRSDPSFKAALDATAHRLADLHNAIK